MLALTKAFPTSTAPGVSDCFPAKPETFGENVILGSSICAANLNHLRFGKFCPWTLRAGQSAPGGQHMPDVPGLSHVLQIVGPVVGPNRVFMVHDQTSRFLTEEDFRDKVVNAPSLTTNPSDRKNVLRVADQISGTGRREHENSLRRESFTTRPWPPNDSRIPADSPQGTRRVSRRRWDLSPFFGAIVLVSHLFTSCVNVVRGLALPQQCLAPF